MNMDFEQQNQNLQEQLPQPGETSLFPMTRRDAAFAICGLIISVFTAIYGIFGGFALGYMVSAVAMFVLFAIYFAKGSKVRAFPIICGVLALANTAVFLCTTNGSVRFFGFVLTIALSLVCFDGFTAGATKGNRQTVHLFCKAIATVGHIGMTLRSLFADRTGNRKVVGKALLGLAGALPVLIIVVPLLISSDDAFRGMVDRMFADTGKTIVKANFGVALAMFAVSYGFSLKTGRTVQQRKGTFGGMENVYILSFLSAISVCYLLYLFSQLAYFFSAFKGFLPEEGITYAQYARKGFFEMCMIAVINLVMVFVVLLLAKKQNGKACYGIRLLATFIAVFTLLIIATAISKMVLYIDAYGMTVLRLTTSAFMVFLAVVFISVILRIYFLKINIVKTALLTAGCIVLMLGTVNVNRVCAEYNYNSYYNGRLDTVDIAAIYDLGDEGIPYITELASDKDPVVAKEAKQYLARAYLRDYFENMVGVQSVTVEELQKNEKDKEFSKFSLPKAAAYDSLYRYVEENPDFAAQCRNYLKN